MLGLDTATEACTVALGTEERTLACLDVIAPRAHLEKLLSLAQELLGMCGRAQSEIDAIAVGVGPGSLTGVRIGVTTARTLAQALEASCIGISTLDVVAHAFSGTGAAVCVVLDAKRGEVYPALYDCSGETPRRLSEYRAVDPGALCAELAGIEKDVLVAGDAIDVYGGLIHSKLGDRVRVAPRDTWLPSASKLLDLARARAEVGQTDFRKVRPIYVRLSDAEEAEVAGT